MTIHYGNNIEWGLTQPLIDGNYDAYYNVVDADSTEQSYYINWNTTSH